MRIVITADGMKPVVIEGMKAVVLAADTGSSDDMAPCIAVGPPRRIAECAALVLLSIHNKLGAAAFEAVIEGARRSTGVRVTDITKDVRSEGSPTNG